MDTSQVQLRSIQSRAFDTTDKEKTMRAIIATLQDLGFMLDRADYTLGVVTASKARADTMQMQVPASLRVTVTVRPRGEKQLLVRANAEYRGRPSRMPSPIRISSTPWRRRCSWKPTRSTDELYLPAALTDLIRRGRAASGLCPF